MSKITRKTQLIFGSSAGANQIEQFGSLANGVPNYTTDPAVIQSLSNFLTGWFGGIVGSNLPAIEDLNALCYLFAYQLAYIFQAGVPEWDSGTTYYTGSIVQSGGVLYTSATDNNLNNAVSNTSFWTQKGNNSITFTTNGSWLCPTGVKNVTVIALQKQLGLNTSQGTYTDIFGNAWAWGVNNGGLGTGDLTPRSSPVAVLGGLTFQKVYQDGGWNSTYGLTTLGKLYAWGTNASGQLGTGNVTTVSSPVAVLGGLSFWKMATPVGTQSMFAISAQNKLFAWGLNSNGNLGVGDVTPRSSPVAVLGGLQFFDVQMSWAQINNGLNSTFGITTTGALYAWGANANGQLGVGNTTPRSSPVAVLGGLTFQKANFNSNNNAFGDGRSILGLTTAGALYGWGANFSGNLGTGDVTPRSSPVAVLGGLTFVDFAQCENVGVFASDMNGNLYAWGANPSGLLGVGDTTPRSSPVAVLANAFVNIQPVTNVMQFAVTPGNTYTIGLQNYFATFNNTPIGKGGIDSVTLVFGQ